MNIELNLKGVNPFFFSRERITSLSASSEVLISAPSMRVCLLLLHTCINIQYILTTINIWIIFKIIFVSNLRVCVSSSLRAGEIDEAELPEVHDGLLLRAEGVHGRVFHSKLKDLVGSRAFKVRSCAAYGQEKQVDVKLFYVELRSKVKTS